MFSALGITWLYDFLHSIADSAAEIAPISVHIASSCNAAAVVKICGLMAWARIRRLNSYNYFSVLLVFVLTKSFFERPWCRGDKENMLLHLRLAIVVRLLLLAVSLTFVLLNSLGPTMTGDARIVQLCNFCCGFFFVIDLIEIENNEIDFNANCFRIQN